MRTLPPPCRRRIRCEASQGPWWRRWRRDGAIVASTANTTAAGTVPASTAFAIPTATILAASASSKPAATIATTTSVPTDACG